MFGPKSLRSFDWISSITSGLFDGFNTYSIDEVVFALGTPVTCRNMENPALDGAILATFKVGTGKQTLTQFTLMMTLLSHVL